MADIITTLHSENDVNINLYPNIKKENIPAESIDRTKLNADVNSLLNSVHEIHPSGVDTSNHILAFTENKGIYIGSDSGYWYYWNGNNYVAGDVYLATVKKEVTLETMANGYMENYHNGLARIHTDNNWKISKPIFIEAGTKIDFVNNGFSSDIVVSISKKRVEGNQYIPLNDLYTPIVTTNNNEDEEVHSVIIIEADGYYYFCDKAQGVATAWHLYFYEKKENDISKYIDLSLFQTIGVIGDSYSSGELQTIDSQGYRTGWKDLNDISWCQIMGRKNGITITNYTMGGVNFRTWLDYFLTTFVNDTKKELYIIALGLNEVNSTLGTYQDADQTPFADTVYGHISELLTYVITHIDTSKTKLIISTIMPNLNTNNFFNVDKIKQINTAIVEVAGRFDIPVIYQEENEYFKSKYFCKYMTYGHPNAVSYSGMAGAYENMIKNCLLYHKEDYFKDLFVYRVSE